MRRERQLRVGSDVRSAKGYWNLTDQLSGWGRHTLGVPPADFPRFFLSAFSFSSSSIISRSINVISVLQRRWSSYNQQQRWHTLWVKRILWKFDHVYTLQLSVLTSQASFRLLVPAMLCYYPEGFWSWKFYREFTFKRSLQTLHFYLPPSPAALRFNAAHVSHAPC